MESNIKNESDFMLSTYDNPFNPFDDFESWFKRDILLKHNCCGLMAIYAAVSPLFSDEVNDKYAEEAVDEIVRLDPTLYRKVTRDNYKHMASAP